MAALDHQNNPGNRRLKHNGALTARITPADFPSTTSGQDTVVVFAIPKGSVTTDVRVINTTAWNGTGAELIVGTSTDDDALVTAANFTATAGVKTGTGVLDSGSSDTAIHAKLSWTAKPTQGESYLVVNFTEYGKNAGAPSSANVAEVSV